MVVNASSSVEGNNPTHYLNLQSLLTARDNIRQSVADGLSLRLAINAMVDATAAVDAELNLVNPAAIDMNVIDESRVYYLGHSLGAITGTNLTAIANTPVPAERFLGATEGNLEAAQGLAAQVNALYKINGTVLSNPGSSIGNFLLESGAFGPLVKASVLAGLGNELTEDFMAFLTPESLGAIIAANPSCAAAATDQNTALVCAYNAFIAQASAEQQAGLAAGLQQFAFAAQAAIEAGDPSNYAQLLRATGTPVLMYEMVGDLAEDGMNPPDQVIPNSVATNPMAGTTGLASQLGLPQVVETISDSSGAVSGIVRFEIGSHSTLLDPSAPAGLESYAAQYGALNQEMQMIMSYFFNSDGRSIQIGNIAEFDICNIKDAVDCE
jgi:Pla-1/cef family extracellular lipase